MTHDQILSQPNKLVFRHSVPVPTIEPQFHHNGLKIWYMENSFVCISPKRAFSQDCCRFIFPYEVAGRCYECLFTEIEPLKYRITRNTGLINIATNKNPVQFKKAISIVHKELTKSMYYYDRITPRTKLLKNYLTNQVFKATGRIVPAYWYNGTIYMLRVDFKGIRAEYKPLISQEEIMKLYTFVNDEKEMAELTPLLNNSKKQLWKDMFNFTQEDFINLIENCTK